MLSDLTLVKAILALFIVLDPLGNVPLFIALTEKMKKGKRKRTFQTATFVSLVLLLIFALLGQQILGLFGISLFAFMIAGGILLLLISMKTIVFNEKKSDTTEEVGAVPIATPLLVGPGAITTTIVLLQTYGIPVTLVSVLVNFFVIRILFRYIDRIHNFLGKIGALVMARIMAILLAAIAINLIVEGIQKAFLG
ncbi:MAG: MarC family protein [Candidatus Aenigmarchaeota archaeon]|nr:MarC family protein [Candidatus Aenigmarchaeota archaeon]